MQEPNLQCKESHTSREVVAVRTSIVPAEVEHARVRAIVIVATALEPRVRRVDEVRV